MLGLTGAGVWAYFNFIKSRTYFPRMEMNVSGEIRSTGTELFVVPRVVLKNIGNSKVGFLHKGSGYRLSWGSRSDRSPDIAWSTPEVAYPVFEETYVARTGREHL